MAQRDAKGRYVRTKPDYKAMYEEYREYSENFDCLLETWKNREEEAREQRDFLLKHAGPILRWMFNLKFKKGE